MSAANNDTLILSSNIDDKIAFEREIDLTLKAILDSIKNEKAFSGILPAELKAAVKIDTLFPDEGLGFDAALEEAKKNIIPHFLHTFSTDYMAHLHSPALIETIAAELIINAFNQSMDSWDQSPVATEIEVEVVRHLLSLFGFPPEGDGVFTSGGSQSNLTAITIARDRFCNETLFHDVKKFGLPESYVKFRIYTSELSHFSMEKSAHLLGLGYNAVRKVPTDKYCRMDMKALRAMVEEDKKNGNLPFLLVATVGTTDFGSIDNIKEMRGIADEFGLFLHADAAYGSGLAVSTAYKDRIRDISLADFVTVDFHKMFLLPISCSAVLVKHKSDFEPFELHADYLNREEDEEEGYTNLVGKSLQTTRRSDAFKVWFAFLVRGKSGYRKIIDHDIEMASALYEKLIRDEDFEVAVKPELSSVVFRVKAGDDVNKRVRKALIHKKGIVIGQTVYDGKTYLKFTLLNPNLNEEILSSLIETIRELAKKA
jgi:Glutamate decarboxylase and related PLP-dependent proteins